MREFQIFTDSCSDLSTEERHNNNVDYFRMNIVVEGKELPADLDWQEYTPDEFYGWLLAGKKIKTTQVPMAEYMAKVRPVLEAGKDVLYLCISSALSGSINTFRLATQELQEEFPEAKIVVVDSLLAARGFGNLVLDCAKLQQEGKTIEEVTEWAEANKLRYNQFCTVDTLKYLKDAGRVKGAAAFFGDIMGVKPIFISDARGNNLVVEKVKGTKASLEALIKGAKETIDVTHANKIWIGQGNAMEKAKLLKDKIEKELGIPAEICQIGPIIGTTTGPGVIATFTFGSEVTRFDGDGK